MLKMEIERTGVLGKGTYGIVYSSTAKDASGQRRPVALKRMIKEVETVGCSSIGELAILAECTGHPFLVSTLTFVDTNAAITRAAHTESDLHTRRKHRAMGTSKTKSLTPLHVHGFDSELTDNPFHPVFEQAVCDFEHLFDTMNPSRGFPQALDPECQMLSLKNRIRMFHHVLCGLEWMHLQNIIHRDIKPQNILVFGRTPDDLVAKLADFGITKHLCPTLPSTPGTYTHTHRAPEIILECPYYDTRTDVWAAGCIFFFMLFGYILFDPEADREDEEDEDEFLKYAMLREILQVSEETFSNIDDFYDNFNLHRTEPMVRLPYKQKTGEKMEHPISTGPLFDALRYKRTDLEEKIKDEYPEDTILGSGALALLRDMLVLNPAKRLGTTALLNKYAALFSMCDPNAAKLRQESILFQRSPEQLAEMQWSSPMDYPVQLFSAEHEAMRLLMQKIIEKRIEVGSDLESLPNPQIAFRALETFERYLGWRAALMSDPSLAADAERAIGVSLAQLPTDMSVVMLACFHIQFKCLVTMSFLREYTFLGDFETISPSAAAKTAEAIRTTLTNGRTAFDTLESLILNYFYKFNMFIPTVFDSAASIAAKKFPTEVITIPEFPSKLALVLLQNYNALKTPTDVERLVNGWIPK